MNGDCYEVHAQKILYSKQDNMKLCHGLVWHPATGWHGHAWLEKGNMVIDVSNGNNARMSKSVYYSLGKIKNIKKYTKKQAIQKMLDTKHYGPWE